MRIRMVTVLTFMQEGSQVSSQPIIATIDVPDLTFTADVHRPPKDFTEHEVEPPPENN